MVAAWATTSTFGWSATSKTAWSGGGVRTRPRSDGHEQRDVARRTHGPAMPSGSHSTATDRQPRGVTKGGVERHQRDVGPAVGVAATTIFCGSTGPAGPSTWL